MYQIYIEHEYVLSMKRNKIMKSRKTCLTLTYDLVGRMTNKYEIVMQFNKNHDGQKIKCCQLAQE